jgi:hypothetical protein
MSLAINADQLAEMIAAGLTPEQITTVLRILERDERDAKAKSADRSRAYRDRRRDEERDASRVTAVTPPSRTRVVIPSLPTEEVKNPPETTSQAPKGATAKRGTRLPADWKPSQADWSAAYAADLAHIEAAAEADKFRDYWHAKPGPAALKLDWSATWRNWCRTAAERRRPQQRGPPQTATRRSSIALVHQMARGREIEQPDQQGDGVPGVNARSGWPGPVAPHRQDAQRPPTLDLEPIRDRR